MVFLKVAQSKGGMTYSMYRDGLEGVLSIIEYGASARAKIKTLRFPTLSEMRAFVNSTCR